MFLDDLINFFLRDELNLPVIIFYKIYAERDSSGVSSASYLNLDEALAHSATTAGYGRNI